MDYSEVAESYRDMEITTKRLELTSILADLIKKTPVDILEKIIYLTQGKIYPDFMGIEIGLADKLVIRIISSITGISQENVEDIYNEIGDIGSTAENLLKTKNQTTLFSEPLTLERVYDVLEKTAKSSGKGSLETRIRSISSLLNDASPLEAKYIIRTVTGRLRLGIADYTVLDALSEAFAGDKSNRVILERAYNLSSDLGKVARIYAIDGISAIEDFDIELFRPVRPMLAERLDSAEEVLKKLSGKGAIEYKLDGERVQVHFKKEKTKIFSRRLEDITDHYPDVIKLCQTNLKCINCIIEGEVVAFDTTSGEYLPFQELMHRRRKYGIKDAVQKYPVAITFFDLLYLNGKDITELPYSDRRKKLEKLVEDKDVFNIVPSKIVSNTNDIDNFMNGSIADGCEGLVAKDLNSSYRAGGREFAWIKLKKEYQIEIQDSLDLTIVGAFHGKGRRTGKYGAFLLAALNKKENLFETICRVGTGFTDEKLEEIQKLLEPYRIENQHSTIVSKINSDIWFIPNIVLEIIASEISLSPTHSAGIDYIRKGSGFALRFPKFTGRIRDDKSPNDSTTIKEIFTMYKSQLKKARIDI
jgi:DNA ligase-1